MIEEKINEEVIDLEIMHKKEFKIIEGIKTSPLIKTDKNPAVLLVHGFGANKHEDVLFDEIAQILAEESILSYRFDLMKKGENNNEYIEPPLSTQRMYLKHILNYIKKQPETDISRIGILGQSLGSLATIITAGDKEIKNSKPLLKTLVLMGASSNIKDTLKWYIESKGIDYNPNEPIIIEAIANIGERPFGRFGRIRRKRTHIKIKAIEREKIPKKKLNKKRNKHDGRKKHNKI